MNQKELQNQGQPGKGERGSKRRCENVLKNGQQGLFLGLLTDLKPDSAT